MRDEGRALEAERTSSPVAFTWRTIAALLGGIGMIVGVLLHWLDFRGEFGAAGEFVPAGVQTGFAGTEIPIEVLWNPEPGQTAEETSFFASVGIVIIVLAAIVLVGAFLWRGIPTRVAGVLGILVVVAFVVSLFRSGIADQVNEQVQQFGGSASELSLLGLGIWITLASSILALIASLLPDRSLAASRAPARTTTAAPPPAEP